MGAELVFSKVRKKREKYRERGIFCVYFKIICYLCIRCQANILLARLRSSVGRATDS